MRQFVFVMFAVSAMAQLPVPGGGSGSGGGGGGSSYYQIVKVAGTGQNQRASLNFESGVTCSDDAGNNETDCSVATTSPYNATFASTTSLSISAGTHGLGTNCVWSPIVFTASGSTLTQFGPGGYTCDNSTGAVTFAFSPAVAGRVMLIPGGSGAGGGGGGGDTTTVANSGAGAQVLKASTNVTARTLVAGSGCTVTENTDTITISCSGVGGSVGYYSSNVAFNPTSMSAGSTQSTTKSVAAAAVTDAIKIHLVPGMIDTCPYVRWEGAVLSVGVVTIYAINPHGAPTCDPDPAQNIPFSVMPQQ